MEKGVHTMHKDKTCPVGKGSGIVRQEYKPRDFYIILLELKCESCKGTGKTRGRGSGKGG